MENVLLSFIKSNVSDVLSLFPKIPFPNDVDFVNFNDRLTVALLVVLSICTWKCLCQCHRANRTQSTGWPFQHVKSFSTQFILSKTLSMRPY